MTNVASDEVFDMTRKWLKGCEESHASCPKADFVPELPHFVVDVSPILSSVIVRLHRSKKGQRAKYLCLSYCWGITEQLTTKASNLNEHLNETSVHKLGLTI
jgi:hypothetical protein